MLGDIEDILCDGGIVMNKPLFIIKKGVAKEVAMIEIDKLCQDDESI